MINNKNSLIFNQSILILLINLQRQLNVYQAYLIFHNFNLGVKFLMFQLNLSQNFFSLMFLLPFCFSPIQFPQYIILISP